MKSKVIICGTNVTELSAVEVTETELVIGSAVTMATLEQVLNEKIKDVNGMNVIKKHEGEIIQIFPIFL